MGTFVSLAELLDRKVEVTCADAVAIVQLLLAEPDIVDATAPYGPPSLENIAVCADGSVRCLHTAATPGLVEAALLLEALVSRAHGRVPGGLRYTIGRGLHEVEAPPFDTTADFAAALTRFEVGSRADRVMRLFNAGSAVGPRTWEAVDTTSSDRRRHEPTAAELRRQLRDVDLRLYEARRQAAASGQPTRRLRIRRGPIAACMAAGLVLVAAGEFSPVTRGRGVPQPAATARTPLAASPSNSQQSTKSVSASSTAPDARQQATVQEIAPARTVRVSSRTARPIASRRSTPPTVRPRTSRPSRSAVAVARTEDSRESKRKADKDRGVLARIRFEWNDPFR